MISKRLEAVHVLFGLSDQETLAWYSTKLKYYLSAHGAFKSIKYHHLNLLNFHSSLLSF